MKWKFLDTNFSDCHTNMAIDEAMLSEYTGIPVFRIYGWRPKAFSVGYFQDPEQELDLNLCGKEGVGVVKRITGGGVIFHKDEVTYSLVCSQDDLDAPNLSKESYKRICSFLINAYRELGLDVRFALRAAKSPKKNWFCFSEKEKYDILINGKKVGGNAQRRRRDIIFQHGSIPLKSNIGEAMLFLKQSPIGLKGNACSLGEALSRDIGYLEVKDILIRSFQKTFNAELEETAQYADACKKARVA